MYNDLNDYCKDRRISWQAFVVNSEGVDTLQVLANAMWYIMNQHVVINDASQNQAHSIPVPAAFENFQGYNEVKMKLVIGNK